MTENEMERLVTIILQRLRKPTLLALTAARGYQQEIFDRLQALDLRFSLVVAEDADAFQHWERLGEVLPAGFLPPATAPLPYQALVLPFMDYPLAADVVSGVLQNPVSKLIHHALLSAIPVLALRYHCDPSSELNQIRGLDKNPTYMARIHHTLTQLETYGVTLCTMNELADKLGNGTSPAPIKNEENASRYITVTDLVSNQELARQPSARLTDAAADYLKKMKK